MLTVEEIKKIESNLSVYLSLSLSLSRLIHFICASYTVFFHNTKHVQVNFYYTKHVHACMHIRHYQNWGRNDLGSGGRLWGKRLDGKWYWGQND